MSAVSGSAPKVYFNKDVGKLPTDLEAVKILLNDSSNLVDENKLDLWPTSGDNEVKELLLNEKMTLTTASNKTLLVLKGERIDYERLGLQCCADNMDYLDEESWGVYPEVIQYRIDTENIKTFVPNVSAPSLTGGVIVADMDPLSQADCDLQAVYRNKDLNLAQNGAFNNPEWNEIKVAGKMHADASNEMQAYGAESLLIGLNKNVKVSSDGLDVVVPSTVSAFGKTSDAAVNAVSQYKPSGELSDQHIGVTYARPTGPHDPADYATKFGTYKISWDIARFKLQNNAALTTEELLVQQDGTEVPVEQTLAYNDYVAADYPANNANAKISVTDYNKLKSSVMKLEVSRVDATKTECFSLVSSTNQGMVDTTSSILDMSVLGDQFPRGDLTVEVLPTHNLVKDAYQNDNLSIILADELLPLGKTASDATITFDSTQVDRTTIVSNHGAVTDIKYAADPIPVGQTEATFKPNGVLSSANEMAEEVKYDGTIRIPSTMDSSNSAFLVPNGTVHATKDQGMVFHMENGISSISVSAVDQLENNILGKMYLINTLGNLDSDENKAVEGTLVSTVDGIAHLQLSQSNNDFGGSDISGTVNRYIIEGGGIGSDALRLKFTPKNLLDSQEVSHVTSNMLEDVAAPEIILQRQDGVVIYDINDDVLGPVNLDVIRANASSLYKQQYMLVFPATNQALDVQAKNAASLKVNGQGVIYPNRVVMSAYDEKDQVFGGNLMKPKDMEITVNSNMAADGYKYGNFVVTAADVSDVGDVRTVSAAVIVPITISGIDNSSVAVRIPVKYSYKLSGGYMNGPIYIDGKMPARQATITLLKDRLINTHVVSFEGNNGVEWAQIGVAAGVNPTADVDLRRYNADSASGETSKIEFSSPGKFSIILKLSPDNGPNSPGVHSIVYTLGAAFKNMGMTIEYIDMTENIAYMDLKREPTIDGNKVPALSQKGIRHIIENVAQEKIKRLSTTMTSTADNLYYEFKVDDNSVQNATPNPTGIAFTAKMKKNGMSTLYFARAFKTLVKHTQALVNDLQFIQNGEMVKLDAGVGVTFSNIQGPASIDAVAYQISLNHDQYVATAYAGQTGQSFNTLGPIPQNRVLIDGNAAAGAATPAPPAGNQEVWGPNMGRNISGSLSKNIVSYSLQQIAGPNNQYLVSWTLVAKTASSTWYILDERDDVTSWSASGQSVGGFALSDKKSFTCKYTMNAAASDYRFIYRKVSAYNNDPAGDRVAVATLRVELFNENSELIEPVQDASQYGGTGLLAMPSRNSYQMFSGDADAAFANNLVITPYQVPTWMRTYAVYGSVVSIPVEVTSSIKSAIYRGYKNGDQYLFHRPQTTMNVTWAKAATDGASISTLSEQLLFDAVALSQVLTKVANLGKALNLNIALSFNSQVAQTYVFHANYCRVVVKFNDLNYDDVIKIDTTTETCPFQISSLASVANLPIAWLEKFKLRNFFQVTDSTITLSYIQSDILIEKNDNYVLVEKDLNSTSSAVVTYNELVAALSSGFNEVGKKSDKDLTTTRDWTVSTFTLNFPDNALAHRTIAKHYIITVAPLYASVLAHGISSASSPNPFNISLLLSNKTSTVAINGYKMNVVIDTTGSEVKCIGPDNWVTRFWLYRERPLVTIRGALGIPPAVTDVAAWNAWHDNAEWYVYPTIDHDKMIKPTTTIVSGKQYQVASLGNSTLAQWQARFSGLTELPALKATILSTSAGELEGGASVVQIYDLVNKKYNFVQQKTTFTGSREHTITVQLSSVQLPRLFGTTLRGVEPKNIRWSGDIQIANTEYCRMYQYLLRFDIDNSTRRMIPVIYKFRSLLFDQSVLGPVADNTNVDGAGGTRDSYNSGHLKQIPIDPTGDDNVKKFELKGTLALEALANKLQLPYKFNTLPDYPLKPFSTNLTSVNFVNVGADERPECMDLVINIRDYVINEDGSVSIDNSETNGTNTYLKIFNLHADKVRFLNIFSKDQFVVKNHLGQLSMRVGPDGQVYASDAHLYRATVSSNNNRLYGSLNQPRNTVGALDPPIKVMCPEVQLGYDDLPPYPER